MCGVFAADSVDYLVFDYFLEKHFYLKENNLLNIVPQLFFIDHPPHFQGVFKFELVKDFDKFLVNLSLYKFKTEDPKLINALKNQCHENPHRREILTKIDSELKGECSLDYYEVETYLRVLNKMLSTLNIDDPAVYSFSIANKVKVILTTLQATRLYNCLETFYRFYIMFPAWFTSTYTEKKDPIKDTKITNEVVKNIPSPPSLNIPPPPTSPTDEIMELCANSIIQRLLVQHIFDHLQYFNKSNCYLDIKEDKIIVNLPILTASKSSLDIEYFFSIIKSLNQTVETEKILYYSNNILKSMLNEKNKDNTLSLSMLSLLFYIYVLIWTYEAHSAYLTKNINECVLSSDFQNRCINHFINFSCKDYKDKLLFNIKDIDLFKNEIDQSKLKEVSDKYSHLILVDELKFIDYVLNDDIIKDKPVDFSFTKKRCIDLNTFIKTDIQQSTHFLDNIDLDNKEDLKQFNLLDYFYITDNNKKRISSNSYEQFRKDLSSLFVNNVNLPQEVFKLFDSLKKIVNQQNFSKNQNNTLGYYNILSNLLPDIKQYSHISMVHIIYQIILPFYVENYGITTFIDQLFYC